MMIVVPAYNEEKNIGRVIRGLFEHGYNEIVVVDDGSTDHTAETAEAAGAAVVRHKTNRGQGAALRTGNEYALSRGADMVAHFDADGQFNPADIAPAVKLILEGKADIVLGSRFLDNRSKLPWSKRYIILPVSRWINYLLTGIKLTDVHNGFRVLNRRALENIKTTQNGMAHNTEIVAQIKQKDLKFAEAPVEITYSEYGQGIVAGFKILRDLFFSKLK
jgi:glycosyltransferase involved in cell wall biosynthesis